MSFSETQLSRRLLRVVIISIVMFNGLTGCYWLRSPDEIPKHVNDHDSLPNLNQWTSWLYTGGEPGSTSPATLSQLGIKTVISVDGLPPKQSVPGIKYHHLPMGYTGADKAAIWQLSQLLKENHGPIYLHCHHGKHRAPAMAAIATMIKDSWSKERATKMMNTCGTNPDYQGLFKMVNDFDPDHIEEVLSDNKTPESQPARWMAQLDRHHDQLKLAFKANTLTTDTLHEAVLLHDAYKEYQRVLDPNEYDSDFHDRLNAAIEKSTQLTHQLRKNVSSAHLGKLWLSIRSDCRACHKRYRD